MDTGLIVALVVVAVVVIALVLLLGRKRRNVKMEHRRHEAGQLREEAHLRTSRAKRHEAAAEEQAAAARRQAAEAEEKAVAARRERAVADRHHKQAASVDPDSN